ncbi:MAG: polyprenyl synthetase family protein [Deltaproteobacteria bacterium]|jgi:geranylgeranyl pyrophosphate synthase|nr:polyprenyl synthetase family protein [Deltaproteobacteria bacterium]
MTLNLRGDKAFFSWRNKMVEAINGELERRFKDLKEDKPPDQVRLLTAMEYSVKSGGKRLRPLLTLSAALATGGSEEDAMNAALAVELIHTYSLIHDDLPALDNDSVRRGVPSSHIAFDEGTAILAGDALQSLAFTILSEPQENISPAQLLLAINTLATAIGPLGMVGGQALDLAYETKHPPLEDYSLMVEGKTACLIRVSLCLGSIVSEAEDGDLLNMYKIGQSAGMAFQIVDDILNHEGDPKLMGKAVGTDASRGKASILDHMDPHEAYGMAKKLILESILLASVYICPQLEWSLLSLVDRLF